MTQRRTNHSSGHAGAGHSGIHGTPLRGSGTPLSSEPFGSMSLSRMKTVSKGILKLAFVSLGIWLFVYLTLIRPTATVTGIRHYEDVLAKLKRAVSGIDHFPDRISSTAKDATFFYQPHFLQGPAILRLRLTLPSTEIAEIEHRLRAEHTPITPTDLQEIAPRGIPPKGLQSTSNKSPTSAFEPFPDDCLSFLITPDLKTAKENWNHPSNVGISISVTRNEIIYWLN